MHFFKYLFGFIFSLNLLGTADSGEWFPVEKMPKAEEVVTDVDDLIWVLFVKKVGGETISVRLPEDPVYKDTAEGFILRSVATAEVFEVTVHPYTSEDQAGDSLFEWEGKWIHEQVVQTGEHTIRLRTYSPTPNSPNHAMFTSSLTIQ